MMEVFRIGDNNYKVKHDGIEEELSLDEVMFLLSQPSSNINWNKKKYEAHEDFWREGND